MLSHFSPVGSFATPWIVALQAHLSMRVSRQEYRRGLPSSPPGELPNPGIKPVSLPSPEMQADSLPLAPSGKLMEQPRARYISIMRLLTERCRSTQTPSQAQVMGGAGSRGPKATGAHTPALGARRDHDPRAKIPLGALPNWSPNPVRLARYTASPDADGRTGERVSLEKAR